MGAPYQSTYTGAQVDKSVLSSLGTINTETTTSRTISSTDSGATVRCTNSSAVTITFPDSLTAGQYGIIQQAGAGTVSWAVSGSMVVTPDFLSTGHTGTSGNPSFIWWQCVATNAVVIGGSTA